MNSDVPAISLRISSLLRNPDILFLDEPLSGLDAKNVIVVKEDFLTAFILQPKIRSKMGLTENNIQCRRARGKI